MEFPPKTLQAMVQGKIVNYINNFKLNAEVSQAHLPPPLSSEQQMKVQLFILTDPDDDEDDDDNEEWGGLLLCFRTN